MGARKPLIAFNLNLATSDLEIAQHIAESIRASSGGLPAVQAMGVVVAVPDGRQLAQVSMNLVDWEQTGIPRRGRTRSAAWRTRPGPISTTPSSSVWPPPAPCWKSPPTPWASAASPPTRHSSCAWPASVMASASIESRADPRTRWSGAVAWVMLWLSTEPHEQVGTRWSITSTRSSTPAFESEEAGRTQLGHLRSLRGRPRAGALRHGGTIGWRAMELQPDAPEHDAMGPPVPRCVRRIPRWWRRRIPSLGWRGSDGRSAPWSRHVLRASRSSGFMLLFGPRVALFATLGRASSSVHFTGWLVIPHPLTALAIGHVGRQA